MQLIVIDDIVACGFPIVLVISYEYPLVSHLFSFPFSAATFYIPGFVIASAY